MLQIENLQIEYQSKMKDNQRKKDLLMDEKNVQYQNSEEDTKKLMVKMLGHLRNTKATRQQIDKITNQQEANRKAETELIKTFNVRQIEVDVVNNMTLLNQIKLYSNETNRIHNDPDLSGHEVRAMSIELLQRFKANVA